MKWEGIALAAVCAGLLYACDDDPASVGMSVDPITGELLIFGALCNDTERIVGVSLVESATGAILWQIGSDVGSRNLIFTVGEVPTGFRLVAPVTPASSGDALVKAEVEIRVDHDRTFEVREEYRLSRLEPGLVRAHGDVIAPEDWPEFVAESYCSPDRGLFG